MGFFDKIVQGASNVAYSAANSAARFGSTLGTAAQDQSELAGMKMQLNTIEQELNASYAQIGRRYVEHVMETGQMPGIDVTDLLKLIDPELQRKQELEGQIIALERKIKDNNILRERQMAEQMFLDEKAKLDRALGMDVLTQAEYDARLAVAQRRLDNFEEIHRLKQQFEMQLITREEYDARMQALTMGG